MKFLAWLVATVSALLFGLSGPAFASSIADRIATFPNWETLPVVEPATGNLVYPNWFAGTWNLTSTLTTLIAPLAPEVTTPGYEGNRQFLQKPVTCQVRFVVDNTIGRRNVAIPFLSLPTQSLVNAQIVSDRAFNGLNLARAYLGDRVYRVWVDTRDNNRLITKFRDNRKLFASATGRAINQPDAAHFLSTEVFQQFFQSPEKPYQNRVEITTAYAQQPDGSITAEQITAVYLLPPHPKAYLAGDRPVALYRYQLEFRPA